MGVMYKYCGVGEPSLEHFCNGEYIMQWVMTLLMIGANEQYSYGTISKHTGAAAKVVSFMAKVLPLPSDISIILDGNVAQLKQWSKHYNNKTGPVKYNLDSLMGGGCMHKRLVEEPKEVHQHEDLEEHEMDGGEWQHLEPGEDMQHDGMEHEEAEPHEEEGHAVEPIGERQMWREPRFQVYLELQADVAILLPPNFNVASMESSYSAHINVGGKEVLASLLGPTKPCPYQLLMDDCPVDFTAYLFSEAVETGHQYVLELLHHHPLSMEIVEHLREQAVLACMWGEAPPLRWAALISCLDDSTTHGNWMEMSEDQQHIVINIKETKRTQLQPLASRKLITMKLPTNTCGGKVLQLWAKVGRPFLLNSFWLEGGKQPFLLGPMGRALGDQSMLKVELLPHLFERCKEAGWGKELLEVAHEVLPSKQYTIRKLYGHLILNHCKGEEEVMLRASMMDTSLKMLKTKYNIFPINPKGRKLMELMMGVHKP